MGEKPTDGDNSEPSLELPSLSLRGLGRRRKPKDKATDAPEVLEAPAPESPAQAEPDTVVETPQPRETAAAAQGADREAARPRRSHRALETSRFELPRIPPRVAAAVTGLLVGGLGTVLTYLAMAGCEAVRGTGSCGGPGLFLLVAILIVMILLGAALLKAWQISDPGSTSFLGVGLVAVMVLVVLIEVIFSAWMFLLVPLLGAAAYLLSHWVTTRFVDEERAPQEQHDVR